MGKNLFDISQIEIGKAWNNASNSARAVCYMKCQPNTTYTISFNDLSNFDNNRCYLCEKVSKEVSTAIVGNVDITTTRTWTTNANSNYICVQFNKTNIALSDFTGLQMQIELGSTATTYTPYNPIELCKIGNYQDYLYKSGDKWYKKQVIGKVVLNGSESWVTRGGATSYAYAVNGILEQNASNGICNYWQFIVGGASNSQQNECMASANTTTSLCIFTNNASLNSVANLKTWLGTHTPTLYYNLQTPQDIEITDTTLINQLNNIDFNSYNPVTNISTDKGLMIIYAEALGRIGA